MRPLSTRTAGFTDSIIRRMTRISNRYGAINLSQGIARKLLLATRERANCLGLPRVGLLVDKENPVGEALYTSVGFQYVNDNQWGGHPMKHLIL